MIEHEIIRIPVARENQLILMISRKDLMNQRIDRPLIHVNGR